jgi:hypothetical protein
VAATSVLKVTTVIRPRLAAATSARQATTAIPLPRRAAITAPAETSQKPPVGTMVQVATSPNRQVATSVVAAISEIPHLGFDPKTIRETRRLP